MSVNQLRRNVRNVMHNYNEVQVLVRKATSNEPWGPSATLMSQIAELTYNVIVFPDIMEMIWRRVNDHGKNWRHVFKALTLLEYLIKVGSDMVVDNCRQHLFVIETLKDFQYLEDNKDHGHCVRERSLRVVALLTNEKQLAAERASALKAHQRVLGSFGSRGRLTKHDYSTSSTSRSPTTTSPSSSTAADGGAAGVPRSSSSSSSASAAIDTAWPQTVGEEDLQLQLAIAMSQEEAEREQQLKKRDDFRLQMALKESQAAAAAGQAKKTSALEDLMSLSQPVSGSLTSGQVNDPWLPLPAPANTTTTAAAAAFSTAEFNPTTINSGSSDGVLDPWLPQSAGGTNGGTNGGTPVPDLFAPGIGTASSPPEPLTDPWQPVTNQKAPSSTGSSSPWQMHSLATALTPSPPDGTTASSASAGGGGRGPGSRSPHDFLGDNVTLVNLDNLMGPPLERAPATATATPAGVPVGAAAGGAHLAQNTSNPFLKTTPPPPTINQIRSQRYESSMSPSLDEAAPWPSNSTNPFA